MLFLVNVMTVLFAFGHYFVSVNHLPVVDSDKINLSQFRSENLNYRDNGLFISDEMKNSGIQSDFLWGPYVPLKQGSYTVFIEYTAESDQNCYAGDLAKGGEVQFYRSSIDILSKHKNKAAYQFEIIENVDEFQFVITYNGYGDFGVKSISVVPNNNFAKRITAELFGLLCLFDGFILFLYLPEQKKKCAAALSGIVILVSLPLAIKGIYFGHDLDIHLLRIESIADALRSGQFPARISTAALWGLGYPFSIYYNDIFLYLPAGLRLLGFSVNTAYKIYLFSINVLTVILSYYSFSRIFNNRRIGMLLTLLYASASYRFVNLFIRAAVGEYTAQAFLPLLGLAMYRIYSDEKQKTESILGNALLMTAAFTGIFGAHMLTIIMTAFLILLIALVLWKRTFRKNTLLTFVFAACLTLLVNLYFLVPFMDYYINVPTYIGDLVEGKAQMIQNSGAFPGQLFAFFQNVSGGLNHTVDGRFQSTPGLPLIYVLLFAFYILIFGKTQRKFCIVLSFAVLTILISLDIWPWNWLALHSVIWKILAQIQFPWRFFVFAVLFLTLLAGETIRLDQQHNFERILALLSVIMTIWFVSDLFNAGNTFYFHDTLSLSMDRTGHEYLLSGTDWLRYSPDLEYDNMETVKILERTSNKLVVYCRTMDEPGVHFVSVPLFNYKGYHVTDENGREFPIENGNQNHIMVSLPDNFDGNISVEFRDPILWTAAMWISVFVFLFLICFEIMKKKRSV